MREAGRNWLRQFLIEIGCTAIFIPLPVSQQRHGRLL